ncbi:MULTISPECIES: DUF3857 domain-containing protein [unclassified Rubrivivax]|uniref:DUF3857 domain-containing protein n=1 Tax=unclassified Rubrivivax TaxID=2649762 RepID=UPI0013E983EA|nr:MULTISPECIES: DUF3857 domain-containing protein [unclassified Rubrivivax]MCC9597229.1 DUF3857 domain-containing protein [Rubrivivax sp. JA1055]MCC9646512.1 DUF3857 domain-containing protein [Rubrivivax sp. JA1029]
MSRGWRRWWAALAAGLLAAGAAAAAPKTAGFEIGREPAWVQPMSASGLDAGLPAAPLQVLLVDQQTRLPAGRGPSERYRHVVRQVRDASGLENASQISIEFDPSYERLTLHRLELRRGGARIDKLAARRVRLLDRETGLEQQRLDGRRTASIVLDDVRVGDRIEFAYTLVGDNPVFDGRFVQVDWSRHGLGPTGLYRYRLLAPAQRHIRHRAGAAEVSDAGRSADGLRITEFRRRGVPRFVEDAYAPADSWLDDMLQLSEFADWADVARWAETLFEPALRPSAEVSAQAEALRGADREARLLAMLDFVQTQVRYFGTEIGASSHRPAPAAQTLAQRYGDCKDKVVLLGALARAAGVRATPVLVSSTMRRDVAAMLPSPLAFDHVVAELQPEGRSLLVDPTRSLQTGPLDERIARGLGWGLPARADATALVELPGTQGRLQAEGEDVLRFASLAQPAAFESVQTFYGDIAEALRAQRAARGADEFERDLRADHLRLYPGLAADGALEMTDVPGRNAVRLVQRYTLPPAWRFPEQRVFVTDYGLPLPMSVLRLPDGSDRARGLRLASPGRYRQSVEFRFEQPTFGRSGSSRAEESAPAFRLQLRAETAPQSQRLEADLEMLQDRVGAAEFPAYRERLVRAFGRLAGTVQVPAVTPAQADTMRARYAALDAELRAGRLRIVTEVQREALGRRVLLDTVLAGDRLAPALRAQTLVERAMLLDHLGELDAARADFQAALALDPEPAATHAAAAVNALMRGAYDEAEQRAGEALRRAPGDLDALQTRARAAYLRGDAAAARAGFEAALKDRSVREAGYAPIWLYLAARRAGDDGVATLRQVAPAGERAWPHPVTRWLAGEARYDDALAATREGGRADPGRECELQFFAGQKALLDGDRAAARRHFRRAVDTGVTEFIEYGMSRLELQRLDGAR